MRHVFSLALAALLGLVAFVFVAVLLSGSAFGQTRVLASEYGVTTDATANHARQIEAAWRAATAILLRDGTDVDLVFPCHAPYRTSGQAIGWAGEIDLNPVTDAAGHVVTFVGCGGARLVSATLPDGTPYTPVREVAESGQSETRLRVLDNALSADRMSATRITLRAMPDGLRPPGPLFHYAFAMRDLVLDGNDAGQLAYVRTLDAGTLKSLLQDSPSHTGINASNHGNVDLCIDPPLRVPVTPGYTYVRQGYQPGLLATLTRVAVVNFLATSALGARCTRWRITESRFGPALYNHTLYNADGGGTSGRDAYYDGLAGPRGTWGGWTDVTFAGAAYGHVVTNYGLRAERIVYERDRPGEPFRDPFARDIREVFGVRGTHVRVAGFVTTDPGVRLFGINDGTAELVPAETPAPVPVPVPVPTPVPVPVPIPTPVPVPVPTPVPVPPAVTYVRETYTATRCRRLNDPRDPVQGRIVAGFNCAARPAAAARP